MKLMRLKIKDGKLILKIDKSIRDLIDDRCKKRFQQLAEQAGFAPEIIIKKAVN